MSKARGPLPYPFHTLQQQQIYERLLLVSSGSAQFYKDACRIIGSEPPFEAGTHLVGHCLREIESALRDVLTPMAQFLKSDALERQHQAEPPLLQPDQQQVKKKPVKPKKPSYEESIAIILEALHIPETDPVTSLWLRLAQQKDDYGLHQFAHRQNLASARPFSPEFLQFWEEMNTVFDRVLDAFTAQYLETHTLIDVHLFTNSASIQEKIDFLTLHMPHNLVALNYFFERLGKEQDRAWLPPLYEKGYFRFPPQPEVDENTKLVSLSRWPAAHYLIQIASLESPMMLRIIQELEPTENVRVYEDCLEIAAHMPASLAKEVIPYLARWIMLPYPGLLPEKIATLLQQFLNEQEIDAALQILDTLLTCFPNLTTPFDRWQYARLLREYLPHFLTKDSVRLCTFFIARLTAHLQQEDPDSPRILSSKWWGALAPQDEALEGNEGLGQLLLSLTWQAGNTALQQVLLTPKALLPLLQLEHYPFSLLKRIALYWLSLVPEQAPEEVTRYLIDDVNFGDLELRREYTLLLRAGFQHLSPATQATFLEWITQGSQDLIHIRRGYERSQHRAMTEDEELRYQQIWQRDWYARLGEALPETVRPLYDNLVSRYGPAELLELQAVPRMAARWNPELSPKTVDDLLTMSSNELIVFLQTWNPEPSSSPWEPGPSWAGLTTTLKNAVAQHAVHFAPYANYFATTEETYIEAVLSGFFEATKQRHAFDWQPVLHLCHSVTEKRQSALMNASPAQRNNPMEWKQTCLLVLKLLQEGLQNKAIDTALQQQVWEILQLMAKDPDPLAEEMGSGEEQDSDKETGNIASIDHLEFAERVVRGKALLVTVVYAQWFVAVREQNQQLPANHEEHHPQSPLAPQIYSILNEHLDREKEFSLTVHASYGEALPILTTLDNEWVEKHLDEIFPQESNRQLFRQVAWNSYCAFTTPNRKLYELLEREYRHALEMMGADGDSSSMSMFSHDEHLSDHLFWLYTQGILLLKDPEGLMHTFFQKAPLRWRRRLFEEIGIMLAQKERQLDTVVQARWKALWEWRVATLRKMGPSGNDEAAELTPFHWWFISGRFPSDWALHQLEAVLQLHGTIDAPSAIIEQLAVYSESEPVPAIRCLALLISAMGREWRFRAWSQQVRTILTNALLSDFNEAQQLAKEAIHRLGTQGEDYRDLLSEPGKPETEKDRNEELDQDSKHSSTGRPSHHASHKTTTGEK